MRSAQVKEFHEAEQRPSFSTQTENDVKGFLGGVKKRVFCLTAE